MAKWEEGLGLPGLQKTPNTLLCQPLQEPPFEDGLVPAWPRAQRCHRHCQVVQLSTQA